MKITLKTLQGKQLPMEIEPDTTVSTPIHSQKDIKKYILVRGLKQKCQCIFSNRLLEVVLFAGVILNLRFNFFAKRFPFLHVEV